MPFLCGTRAALFFWKLIDAAATSIPDSVVHSKKYYTWIVANSEKWCNMITSHIYYLSDMDINSIVDIMVDYKKWLWYIHTFY